MVDWFQSILVSSGNTTCYRNIYDGFTQCGVILINQRQCLIITAAEFGTLLKQIEVGISMAEPRAKHASYV